MNEAKRSPARRWVSALLGATAAALLNIWWFSHKGATEAPAPEAPAAASQRPGSPTTGAEVPGAPSEEQPVSRGTSELLRPAPFAKEKAADELNALLRGEPDLNTLVRSPLVLSVHRGADGILVKLSTRALELARSEVGRAEIQKSLERYVAPLGIGAVTVQVETERGSIVPLERVVESGEIEEGPRRSDGADEP